MAQNTLSALLPLGIIMGALTASGCGLHLVPMLFHGEVRCERATPDTLPCVLQADEHSPLCFRAYECSLYMFTHLTSMAAFASLLTTDYDSFPGCSPPLPTSASPSCRHTCDMRRPQQQHSLSFHSVWPAHLQKRRTLLDSWKFQMFNRDKTIDAMTK
jgi:hypothetical protein